MHTCHVHVCRSVDNLREFILSFTMPSFQVTRFGGKHFYSLNHLAGPEIHFCGKKLRGGSSSTAWGGQKIPKCPSTGTTVSRYVMERGKRWGTQWGEGRESDSDLSLHCGENGT